MLKKTLYIFFIIFFYISPSLSSDSIYIFAKIDDNIITNLDIKKEGEYLKSLNKNLTQLNNDKIFNIAKNSLINEIIKKKELEKFVDLTLDHPRIKTYLKDLYSQLNINSEAEFENYLINKKYYSIDEIKQKLKIEILWNELIYNRYINQVKIDENLLIRKIKNQENKTKKEYLLSEIIFEKKKNQELETIIKKIILSIEEIGFNNTANVYSISESAKLGGKIGWIDEKSLSEKIIQELNRLEEKQYSKVMKIGNNFLILKIEEIRFNKIKIDQKEELNKMIVYETNKQLNQFSRIFFNKSKINYSINEK